MIHISWCAFIENSHPGAWAHGLVCLFFLLTCCQCQVFVLHIMTEFFFYMIRRGWATTHLQAKALHKGVTEDVWLSWWYDSSIDIPSQLSSPAAQRQASGCKNSSYNLDVASTWRLLLTWDPGDLSSLTAAFFDSSPNVSKAPRWHAQMVTISSAIIPTQFWYPIRGVNPPN